MEPMVDAGYRLACSMLMNRTEAEDALQDAILNCWKHFDQLHQADVLKPWFLSIVANQCRSRRRRRPMPLLADWLPLRRDPVDETVIERHDLNEAVRLLPTGDRAALVLRFYLDLSTRDMAQVLGISESAAKVRVHRASERLRRALEVKEVSPSNG